MTGVVQIGELGKVGNWLQSKSEERRDEGSQRWKSWNCWEIGECQN